MAAYHGNNYLPLLEAFYRSHRAALFTLVDSIELEATSEDRAVLDALEFVRAVRHLRGEWIGQSVTVMRGEEKAEVSIDIAAFASEMWKRTLRDKGYSQDKPETRSRKRFPWSAGVPANRAGGLPRGWSRASEKTRSLKPTPL